MPNLDSMAITISIAGQYSEASDLTTRKEAIGITMSKAITHGSGSNQANRFFSDTRSTTNVDTLNFNNASLTDAFGNTIVLTKINQIII